MPWCFGSGRWFEIDAGPTWIAGRSLAGRARRQERSSDAITSPWLGTLQCSMTADMLRDRKRGHHHELP